MKHVKPPHVQRYKNYLPTAFDGTLTMLEKVNLVIKFMQDISLDFNEVVDFANEFDDKLKIKEDSNHITKSRKLSSTGNFTGTLDGKPVSTVFNELTDNRDKIAYLTSQFSNGQTGLVIDGGYFEASEIQNNYDGGVF